MSTRVDVEEIEATRSEKFLAVVLAAFLLIGSIWFYVKIDDWVPGGYDRPQTAAERSAYSARESAWKASSVADARLKREKSELTLAKNDFDIAVGKGSSLVEAETAYKQAEAELAAAQVAADRAQARVARAEKVVARLDRAREAESHAPHAWAVAGIRLAFVLGWFVAALRLVRELRRRRSRFLPLGFATAAAGVVTALVYATDYITDYINPLDLGPIVLSVAGAAATIGAFVGLQRWLAHRIPGRRVRNGECPFCGTPIRQDGRHCVGCGREIIAPCVSCGQPRRVGSPHCANCGAA